MLPTKFQVNCAVQEKKRKIDFQDGATIGTILAILDL